MSRPKNKDEYRAELAETFAHVLEEKGLEWQKEWRGSGNDAPHNGITKACYRGSNAFWLSLIAMMKGYNDPRWVTMVQIMDADGKYHPKQKWHLKKGSKATYLDARSDANINQLLLIPCVILDFLCIHPFRDGNGRMSRLLSLLLLYKNGFDAGKYVSFEEQISNYKAYYYEALRQSSAGWETNENSYFPFMENFLSTLYMCYKELDKRFAVVHGKKVTKKARVEATVLNSLTPLSKAEICKILPDVSPTTVEAVLGVMVKTGSIRRIGAGRTTRYIKAQTER